ncbi:restriction endonuclease subunit S [Bacteroidia bacterium]|nr:restriction endonuclease subunit S [Bacteroidia bacterium]
MNDFISFKVCEVTDNFDNLRVPLSATQRKEISKVYPYYGAQSIIDYVDDYIFDGEYILVAEDGENLKSQNSNVCNLVNGKFWVNNHAHIIKGKDGHSTRYMYYYLNLIDFKPFITGSAQPKLTKDNLNSIPLKLHKKEEQQKIANVLSTLDAKIELNNKINAELEAMAKLVYDYWFVQFDFPTSAAYAASVGKPLLAGQPYKASGGKMVYNEVLRREIPEGWEVDSLSSWIKTDKSGDWGKESEQGNYITKVRCLRGADINGLKGKGDLKAPTRFILEKNEHKILDPFDLIVEISGGSPTQSTGRLGFVTEETMARFESPFICSNFCKALALKNTGYFYNFIFAWERVYDAGVLFGYEGKTSGIKNLLFDSFVSTYQIPKPPKELANKFFEFMSPSNAKVQNNLKQNQELAELRDWLLPMLINGQVTVGDAEEKVAEYGAGESVSLAAEGEE